MTIYGGGTHARSFQYVNDLVNGLHKLMNGNYDLTVSFGNPEEYFVKDFAQYIQKLAESKNEIVFLPKSHDDSSQRRPDIATTKRELGWQPVVPVEQSKACEKMTYDESSLDEVGKARETEQAAGGRVL